MEQNTSGGIRTHEALAVDLKSTPFDRSGTLVKYNIQYTILPALPIKLHKTNVLR